MDVNGINKKGEVHTQFTIETHKDMTTTPDKTKKCQGCSTGGICGDRHVANSFSEDHKGDVTSNADLSKCTFCGGQHKTDCGVGMALPRIKDPFLEKTLAEFDNMFDLDNYGESHIVQGKVKDFLRSALNAQREEIREKVEEMRHNEHHICGGEYCEVNITLDRILALL